MAKNGCLKFPFEEDVLNQSLRHTTTVKDTIESSIRCFVVTSPGQRRGNRIGSFLPSVKHQLFSEDALAVAQDTLKQELSTQFPGIAFEDVALVRDLSNDVSSLQVHIQYSTAQSDVSQMSFLV